MNSYDIKRLKTNHPKFAIEICTSLVNIADVPYSLFIKLLLLGSVHIVAKAKCVDIACDIDLAPM